jgi:hypothetical protein
MNAASPVLTLIDTKENRTECAVDFGCLTAPTAAAYRKTFLTLKPTPVSLPPHHPADFTSISKQSALPLTKEIFPQELKYVLTAASTGSTSA